MKSFEEKLKNFAKELFEANAIKFGEYKTKIGVMTPVYCDLRVIVSYPKLMDTLADLLIVKVEKMNVELLCGVPYTALPIATAVSLKLLKPMVMRRKEAKDYGTKKLIEGIFTAGQTCLIVEDVVTSGSSILETAKDLNGVGIKCTDAIVLLNREQGGEHFLMKNGIKMHSLLTLTQMVGYLREFGCVDDAVVEQVKSYLANTQIDEVSLNETITKDRLGLSFLDRAKYAKNPVSQELFKIMSSKQTTLCVAADLTNSTDILNLAERVGPHICALKTHIDIVEDFHPNMLGPLQEIANRHNFILFEDRKFCDIGKTVEYQYSKGGGCISSWANLVTAHSLLGKGVLDAIKGSEGLQKRGVFLLAETSAAGSLITESYVKSTLEMAEEYSDLVAGIVCQSPLFLKNPGLIQLTPGVRIDIKKDDLGQQYNSPASIVLERGADIAVVGRGITLAKDPEVAAAAYKKLLWDAYLQRIKE
ncbi:rudimentary-like [Leptinotarsa decemlineata]|uniref:rudimentary-like n=1 Tax=Leptinotarsa decemlineata TaxID=7539 RepID=UPI003D30C97E